MNTQYTPEYFIKKFEAIPEELWITKSFSDSTDTRHDAFGHCGVLWDSVAGETRTYEADSLADMFASKLDVAAAAVNDGYIHTYTQPTPKQRILAALRDIAEMEKK